MRVLDPRYAADRGEALDEIAGDFRVHDIEHLTVNRARVRRAWAQNLVEAGDRHPLQARVIRKQAALRRGHLPLRRLLDQASDVLFAIKPCWAMSPLMVSQVLPVARLFDVVIFDEASQIVPADAIPAIMRGHQIVVAGDDRQLPPTNFFRQVGDPDDDGEDDENLVSFGAGFARCSRRRRWHGTTAAATNGLSHSPTAGSTVARSRRSPACCGTTACGMWSSRKAPARAKRSRWMPRSAKSSALCSSMRASTQPNPSA
jgi:hypothetical protein